MPVKVYDNFLLGHYGNIDPAKAPEGSYFGSNVLTYRNGTVGPRPGFRAHAFGRTPTARVFGFAHMENIEWPLVYVEGTNAYRTKAPDAATPSAALLGTIGTRPTDNQIGMYDAGLDEGGGYIHVPEGASFRVDHLLNAGTPAAITQLSAATNSNGAACVYGVRLYLVGQAIQSDTVFFSNASDDATWTASDFFTVSLAKNLQVLAPHRGHLTIGTADGQWFVLSGVPGSTGTLRRITDPTAAPAILIQPACVVGGDNLWFLKPRGSIPSYFDGVKVTELAHLALSRPNVPYGQDIRIGTGQAHDLVKTFLLYPDSPAMYLKAGNGRMMLLNHGAWTRHDFGVALDRDWTADGRGRMYAFEQWTGVAGQRMFVTDIALERPGFAADTFASPGDDSDTPLAANLELPQFWHPDGSEMRVRQVRVDIAKWDTGSATANQLDVAVDVIGRRGVSGVSTTTRTWVEAGAGHSTDTTGTPDRLVLDFGATTPGGGFQVRFPIMRGVAIRSVRVVYDEYPGRPRQ